MRLHDQHGARIPGALQPLAEPLEIARQPRPDIGVHHRGGEALEFLDLAAAPPTTATRRHPAVRGATRRPRCARDVDRARRAESRPPPPRRPRLQGRDRLVKGFRGRAGSRRGRHGACARSPAGAAPAAPVAPAEASAVVAFDRLEALAHLDHVAVALRHQHAGARALAFEQRIGGDRGAMHDARCLRATARRSVPPACRPAVPVRQAPRVTDRLVSTAPWRALPRRDRRSRPGR